MKKHLISVGDLVIDLITPVSLPIIAAQHQEVPFMNIEPGGGSNFMIAASRIGLRVSSVGMLGDDTFGQTLLNILHSEGVDTTGVHISKGADSPLVLSLIDHQKREHVFIGRPNSGPEVAYSDAMDGVVRSANALFFQGYTLLERQIAGLVTAAAERGRELNIPIYFDVGPTVKHSPAERVRWMISKTDVVLTTEDEVELVSEGAQGDSAFEYLLSLGPKLLVIKQGANGCTLVQADSKIHVPGFTVQVVDTVGAGDCFDAAFIYGQLYGLPLRDCAILANAIGAASVQKLGAGRNVPTCAEANTVLQQARSELRFSC
jgi:sugar/nucleoside kinase (ribokinase family)